MIVLSATQLGKSYFNNVILDKVSFSINAGDKVGIVGGNGAGKTTLLNILSQQLEADEGSTFVSKETKIGYLKQKENFDLEDTVISQVSKVFSHLQDLENQLADLNREIEETKDEEKLHILAEKLASLEEEYKRKGGYTYKSEIVGILNSLSFGEDYYNKPVRLLSGGERTRLALAALLLEKPDILFLDEPTNHLDIGTVKWLEQYIKSYKGTVVLISHDRYFLDQCVNIIFHIENHHLEIYRGNYSFFAKEREVRLKSRLKEYEIQQKEIKKQEDLIRSYKERKTEKLAKRAASREKALEKIKRIEKPKSLQKKMSLNFNEDFKSGKDVIYCENVSKSFGYGVNRRLLFENVNADIKRGEKICIVGQNGCGKTTFLKMINQEIEGDSGFIKIGYNVEMGYYDQGQLLLDDSKRLIDEIHDDHPLMKDGEIRGYLGRFLFTQEDVFRRVGELSGGERARLSLLKLMIGGGNLLILDEPTNHLDIESKEVIEKALLEYDGTIIVVSHDRYFLNKIPTRILELTSQGFVEYLGKFDYYQSKKEEIASGKAYVASLAGERSEEKTKLSSQEERREKKKQEAEERRKLREKEKLEKDIAKLEEEIKSLEEAMCMEENFNDHNKLLDQSTRCESLKLQLEQTYEKWMLLTE